MCLFYFVPNPRNDIASGLPFPMDASVFFLQAPDWPEAQKILEELYPNGMKPAGKLYFVGLEMEIVIIIDDGDDIIYPYPN